MNYLDQSKYDDLFFEADQMIADKNFGGAISNLEAIIAEAPEFGKAYNHLGWIQETKFKDYTKAEQMILSINVIIHLKSRNLCHE